MFRKVSLLFLLLFSVSWSSSAQTTRVVDVVTGAGIADVKVGFVTTCIVQDRRGQSFLSYGAQETVTDSNGGFYSFSEGQGLCTSYYAFGKTGYRFSNGRPHLLNQKLVYYGTTLPEIALTSAASFRSAPPPSGQVTSLEPYSASSIPYSAITGGMIGVIFGKDLATQTESARTQPLPGSLAGRVVIIKKSDGGLIGAQMLYVSPTQINFVVPDGIPLGSSIVQVHKGNEITHAAFVDARDIFPSLFSVNANGEGVLAGYVLGVKPDDSRRIVPIQRYDSVQKRYVAAPVEFGPSDERLFLVLYGTGFRQWTDLSKVSVTVGGTEGTVTYAGSQLVLAGLDQINLLLPRTLAGRGEINIEFKINNIVANTVTVAFK